MNKYIILYRYQVKLVVLLGIILLCSTFVYGEPNRLVSKDGQFQVEFPLPYSELQKAKNDSQEKKIYSAGNPKSGPYYQVIFAKISVGDLSRSEALSRISKAVTANKNVIRELDFNEKSYQGKDIIFSLNPGMGDGSLTWARTKVILAEGILYQMEFFSNKKSELVNQENDHFFSSFKLMNAGITIKSSS